MRGEVTVVLRVLWHGGRVGVGGVVAVHLDRNLAADAPRRDLGRIFNDVLGANLLTEETRFDMYLVSERNRSAVDSVVSGIDGKLERCVQRAHVL